MRLKRNARRDARGVSPLVLVLVVVSGVLVLALRHLAIARDDAPRFRTLATTAQISAQRIAYLTLISAAHEAAPAQLNAAIGALRGALDQVRAVAPPPADASARQSSEDQLERYLSAAAAEVGRPNDPAARALVRALRPAMPAAIHADVARYAAADVQRNLQWVIIVVVSIGIAGLLLLLAGLRSLISLERRITSTRDAAQSERNSMQSLLDENPDAVAIYDCNGLLVRTNRARAALIGCAPGDMIGQHVSTFIEASQAEHTARIFDEVKNGRPFAGEVKLRAANGDAIDVHLSAFPNVVAGTTQGVLVVSRDLREITAARLRTEELARRLAALCEIVSVGGGDDWVKQIDEALALAAGGLEFEWGLVGELAGADVNVISVVGGLPGMHAGLCLPLELTMTRSIIASAGVFELNEQHGPALPHYNALHGTRWRHFVGMRLVVSGSVWGTFGLGGATPRTRPLDNADRDFLAIVATLIGSIVERARQHARLDTLAFRDALTGLPNRIFVTRKLDELLAIAGRDGSTFAVHFIDLDRFKAINDTAGHATGDCVLRDVAQRFAQCVRECDTVARLGGDEFLVLQRMGSGRCGANELAERLEQSLADPFVYAGVAYELGCSIGISVYPDDGNDAMTLIKRADEAMYLAKAARWAAANRDDRI